MYPLQTTTTPPPPPPPPPPHPHPRSLGHLCATSGNTGLEPEQALAGVLTMPLHCGVV